jgi:hypothetical protein
MVIKGIKAIKFARIKPLAIVLPVLFLIILLGGVLLVYDQLIKKPLEEAAKEGVTKGIFGEEKEVTPIGEVEEEKKGEIPGGEEKIEFVTPRSGGGGGGTAPPQTPTPPAEGQQYTTDLTICQNAKNGDLCDGLDIVYGSGYKITCCSEHNLCC